MAEVENGEVVQIVESFYFRDEVIIECEGGEADELI